MSESKHTPGPWIVDTDYIIQVGGTSDENTIAIVGDQEEWKANAHLIAAAPEMLKELEYEQAECRERLSFENCNACIASKSCSLLRVINKAKGVQDE